MSKCQVEGCMRAYRSRGYCWKHLTEAKEQGVEIPDFRSKGPLPEIQCRVDGCEQDSTYRGKKLCMKHYLRIFHHGTTDLAEPPTSQEILESRRTITKSGCWEWQGAVATSGYGRMGTGYTHRVAHEIYIGEIPPGYQVDHLCRNKLCFNPGHLEAVTQEVNLQRQLVHMKRDTSNGRLRSAHK